MRRHARDDADSEVLDVPMAWSARSVAVGFVVGALLMACAPTRTPLATSAPLPSLAPLTMYVADVDGPPVDLLINGELVAQVPCSGYALLAEGDGGVPSLPWSLDVARQGGALLQHYDVEGGPNLMLLLRGDTISLGEGVSVGPAVSGDVCARWSASPGASL